MTTLAELRGSRELLVNLTMREVRGKYKRTALGQAWSLVNPIATILIYTFVFGLLVKAAPGKGDPSGVDVYGLWLACALLPWNFFASAMGTGMGSLLGNSNLIKKVYFPREVIVGSTVFSWDFTFLVELAVLAIVMLVAGAMVLPWLPVLLVLVVLLTGFALGISLALSVANVYFRDTPHFMNIFMQLWFYATPIVYPISLLQRQLHPGQDWIVTIYRLNPMERFSEAFRAVLYDARFPDWTTLGYITACALVTLVVGQWLFNRYEGRLAEEL
jgi:ABC-2 type transport system permease protein